MADRFNLTAQLQLQAPTNTRQVVNQIRSQLQGVTVNVQVQANARAIGQVNAGLQATTRQANDAARSVGFLNRNLSEAARRFGVITLATGTMLSFAQSVKRAVGEAIEFERELVRIAQTTGKSVRELSDLSNEVTKLATSLGVSSSSLLSTANVLAQAGFSAKTTKQALDILAKTTLGPTFDDVTETVEGAVSVLSQFRQEAMAAGGDIKFLESTLDAINSVSKAFAVESSDLITIIRRTGGVFAAAGGSVNELIALFTSVRATTRESAETIATGLRTIFTRIQRTDTVNQLEQLGISLRDAEGNFIGAFEAVKRLSAGLSAIDPRNYRFSQIVEELGGFRQIGKVIPLIQQFAVAQDALNVAQSASGSVAEDALTAQQSLAVQATKVREEFAALIRTLANSETFRGIAAGALELARALIKIGEALEPVLPLLTSLLALKIGQGLAPGLAAIAGFGGGRRRGAAFGGVIRGFARGGYVPGSGNRDTVPAMLQPGEFVIKKSSAQKLGPATLTAMNENRYVKGGISKAPLVDDILQTTGSVLPKPSSAIQSIISAGGGAVDIDRTIKRTVGDTAYMKARTKGEQTAVLDRYFRDPQKRLQDIKSASITQFGKELQNAIKSGELRGNSISIISKSQRTPGVAEYLSSIFGIPTANMIFTQGADKQPAIDALRTKGPRVERSKKMMGGVVQLFKNGGRVTPEEYYAAAKNSPLNRFELDSIVKYAKTNDFSIAEFKQYLAKRIQQKKSKESLIMEPMSLLRAITPEPATISSKQSELAKSLMGPPDAKYNPKYDTARKKFQIGGEVREELARNRDVGVGKGVTLSRGTGKSATLIGALTKAEALSDVETYGAAFLRPVGSGETFTGENNPQEIKSLIQNSPGYKALQGLNKGEYKIQGVNEPIKAADQIISRYAKNNKYNLRASGLSSGTSQSLEDTLLNGVINSIQSGVKVLEQDLAITGPVNTAAALKQSNIDQTIGNLFESVLTFAGSPYGGNDRDAANAPFDFPYGLGNTASKFPGLPNNIQTDAKSTYNAPNVQSIIKKVNNKNLLEAEGEIDPIITEFANSLKSEAIKGQLLKTTKNKFFGGRIGKYANGGNVDTVPSLLTPGEFVINKKSAQSIGYSNLHRMNQTGVSKFNTGGVVGVQKFANGGVADRVSQLSSTTGVPSALIGQYIASVQAQIKNNNQNLNDTQALNLAILLVARQYKGLQQSTNGVTNSTNNLQQNISKLFPSFIGLSKTISSFSASVKNAGASIGGSIGGAISSERGQREIQGIDRVAGALQQFVFLGATASALASQFTGLEDSTKRAISETAGFVTSIVGTVGTITQLGTSLLSNTTSQVANTTACNINTTAQASNTVATQTNTAAQTSSAATLSTAFAGIVIAITAVASVFQFLESKARAAADVFEKSAQSSINTTRETGVADVSNTFGNAVKGLDEQMKAAALSSAKFDAVVVGGVVGVGALIAGFSTAGTSLAALGAAASAGAATYKVTLDRENQIRERTIGPLQDLVTDLVNTNAALGKFENALNSIDIEQNLLPEQRVERRIQAQEFGDTSAVSYAAQQQKNIAKALKKDVAAVTESDLAGLGEPIKLAFEIAAQTITNQKELLDKSLGEARKTLSEAAKLELTGELNFDQVIASGGQLSDALKNTETAIKAKAASEVAILEQRIYSLAKDDDGLKQRIQLQQQIESIRNREKQQLEDTVTGLKNISNEAEKNVAIQRRAAAAQEAYRQELLKISEFTNALVSAEQNLNKLEQSLNNLSNYVSGDAFDVSRLAPAGLDDLTQVGDRDIFEKVVKSIADDAGPAGQLLADKVITTSKAIDTANKELTNVEFGKGFTSDEFLNRVGINKDMLGGAKDKFEKAFEDAMIDSKITQEEMKQLLEPIENGAKESADALKRAAELQNKELSLYQKYLGQLQEQRDKEVSARQSLTDILLKAVELRAEARGEKITPEQREAFRQQRAQQGLQGVTDVAGKQLIAGDVAGVSAARLRADQRRSDIQKQIQAPEFATLDNTARQNLIAEDKELANVVAKTTDELNRLTDQSSRASDILGEIDKERGKRETLTGIIEDFVVGGGDQRQAINQAFAGIQNAISTGTLQGQTPEQRKATVDMLDKLANFELPGAGGLTGKEVKQKLIFQDAIKMGLDPRVADQLSRATSKEEQLINALDALTLEMRAAGQANVDLEEQRRKNIEAQAKDIVPGAPIPIGGAPIPAMPVAPAAPLTPEQQFKQRREDINVMPRGLEKGKAAMQLEMDIRKKQFQEQMSSRKAAVSGPVGGGMFQIPPEQIIPRQQQAQAQQNMVNIAGAVAPQPPIGAMQMDTAPLSGIFDNFLGNFSGVFDNIVKTFSGLQASFTTLAQSMSGMTMEHHVNVEGLISVGGLNIEAIKSELSTSIGQMVAMEVQKSMDEQRKTFRAG